MSTRLIVAPVENAAERTQFVRFQWEVYKDDPYWVPSLVSERESFINPEHNPFFKHGKIQCFLARRGDKVVGRIAGIINYNHNHYWNDKVGFFGLYEVLEDREASDALLEAAENFVRNEGMNVVRGPMNYSTNEECGLLVDGWGIPVMMITYNPRYYVDLIENSGYVKAQDLYAYRVDLTRCTLDGGGLREKTVRVAQKVREHMDITIRPINMRDFDVEAERFKAIYNAAWSKNWGFVPVTEEEFDYQLVQLKPFLDPRMVFFAEKGDALVGAMLPLPDINQVLHKAYPRPGVPDWWSMTKLLYWWKIRKAITTIRAFAGGVIEEYRGRGVDAVLFMETFKAGLRQGYKNAEISWVLESNQPMRQTAVNFGAEIYRTYRVYDKTL